LYCYIGFYSKSKKWMKPNWITTIHFVHYL
jgi:hypothetical protein